MTSAAKSGSKPASAEPASGSVIELIDVGMTPMRLEELVSREAAGEAATSIARLFALPTRIYSNGGALLGQAAPVGFGGAWEPREGDAHVRTHEVAIEYDRRAIGRAVLGPYIVDGVEGAPAELASATDPASGLPRLTEDRVRAIGEHLASTLDLVIFSSHRALLTSQMHLASMRESYRELSDKTRRLEEAYERLKELDRLKSNFLATVSHELRTPLTSIMGYAEMLLEGIGGPMGREQLEFVETIRAKGDQLLALIMSLLDLSKLESGTAAMSVRRVAIGEVLLDVVQTLTPAAKKKNVRLTVRIDDALPALSADPDRLRQVFLNLAENGLKFTPTGGEVALVATVQPGEELDPFGLVLVAPTRQSIEVRVQDTGIGIPLAQRARVFDAFYQVDQSSTREYGGAGLGLAIVKRLVDAHGGSIRVEETTPHGTTFIVTLPCSSPTIQPLMDSPFSDT